MANKQFMFLNGVKTPYGDVAKGEILTGIEFLKPPTSTSSHVRQMPTPGFIFNFYEKKDPARFLDKSVEETFFIPKTAFANNGTIREATAEEIKKSIVKTNPRVYIPGKPTDLPVNTDTDTTNNSNKMISFVLGALAGVIVGYVVLNKIGK